VPYEHNLNVKKGWKPKFSRIWVQQGTVHCHRWTFQVHFICPNVWPDDCFDIQPKPVATLLCYKQVVSPEITAYLFCEFYSTVWPE